MIRTGVFLLALCTGVIFHVAVLFWLHQCPLSLKQKLYDNATSHYEESCAIWLKQQRLALVSDFFDLAEEQQLEAKEELHELKAEYPPNLEFSFPTSIPYHLSESEFAFENKPFGKVIAESDACAQAAAVTLIAPLSTLAPLKAPPLADLFYEDAYFDEVGTLAGSEHFDIQVEYAPKRTRPGYVFKVTLLPRSDVHFKRIRQNFYFLVDRSNSIPRARYAFNKKAVASALDFLKKGDRFNILLFDSHVVRFQEKNVEWSEESVMQARAFLEKQGHGGYFAATELYASLGKIIPRDVAENELHVAVLLSDGDTYLSCEKQRLTIGKWTAQNKGKVALYTLASGTGNNLPLLELLSSFNKGSLLYTPDHQQIGNRLTYLMRTLQHPIGKQMVATAVCEEKSMNILLQPKSFRIPDLYQNRPFVIFGTTNKLADFVLFLQGRYYDQRFDIKKKICFDKAQLGTHSVERGWTQLVVQEFYERFFEDGNLAHLETAKQLLVPLNLPTPLIE